MRQALFVVAVFTALAAGDRVHAQNAPRPAPSPLAQLQARQQIAAFELALEHAVRNGAQMFDQRLQTMTAANMVMLAGLTRARGFRLEDYGLMFDVEFPSMRRSVVWSIQELERERRTSTGGQPQKANADPATIRPRDMYQSEITAALLNAILDLKEPLGIAPAEWLTVAARESVADRRIVPGDPADAPMTVILRINGADLQALREGRMTRDEGRNRVGLTQY